ncbi:MAG: CvpA family protein [Cryomorphaceae bacterium]|nr:MAG: CvpA family protein [Cryomorphaceae bacterium]
MSYIDLLILVPLLWGAVRGFMKGFIVSVGSLVALALGIYGAIVFSDQLGLYLQREHGMEGPFMPVVAFSLVFLAIVVGVYFLARIIQKTVEMAALGLVNKLAGSLFGIMKAVLICSVVILLLEKIHFYVPFLPEEQIQNSFVYQPVADVMQVYFPRVAESEAFKTLIKAEFLEEALP